MLARQLLSQEIRFSISNVSYASFYIFNYFEGGTGVTGGCAFWKTQKGFET